MGKSCKTTTYGITDLAAHPIDPVRTDALGHKLEYVGREVDRKRVQFLLLSKEQHLKSGKKERNSLLIPINSRLNRHTSLVLPRLSTSYDIYGRGARQRMNSWCGLHGIFSPCCPVHGRQALIEAYARDKFIQVCLF